MIIPLIKGLEVAPFWECPRCHALTRVGVGKCSGCAEEMSAKEDPNVSFLILNTGAQYKSFTPFVQCPNCRKLLRVGVSRCPDCYEEVPEEYAFGSAVAVVVNTVACETANSIRSFDAFAVLAVIGSVGVYVTDVYAAGSPTYSYFLLVWSAIPLSATLLWFFRFGRFDGDDEYLAAKHALTRSLLLWLGIMAAQFIAFAVWWF